MTERLNSYGHSDNAHLSIDAASEAPLGKPGLINFTADFGKPSLQDGLPKQSLSKSGLVYNTERGTRIAVKLNSHKK
ncbi:MAG: hypothetical protein Kow0065_01150 [Methylomicrobium sp.]